jgi:DNA polymerase-3 subunit beta
MKIICTQENLNRSLFIVNNIAGKNINLPILNNVLIRVENKIITLSTTNLEIGVHCSVRGRIEKEGSFTVPARLLTDFISLLTKEQFELSVDNDELVITSKNHQAKIKGLPADDFPLIPQIEKKTPFICDAQEFKKAISQVVFAITINETRPEISGVLFNFNAQKATLTLVGTDSYRLAEKTLPLKKTTTTNHKIIVPLKTVQEIARILGSFKEEDLGQENNIEIYLSEENQILFSVNEVNLISRVIEGQYPEYKEIIPTTFKIQAIMDKQNFINIIKTSSLFSQTGINSVNLEFLSQDQVIKVSSANLQTGEEISQLEGKIEGQDNKIALNYRFLLDGLAALTEDEVLIEVIDKDTPCLIKSPGKEDYLYIIMPIRQ